MTEKKPQKDEPKETGRIEDLPPQQDPKGGQATAETPLRTPLRDADRGGWDGNHNITVVAPARRRRRARH